MNDQLIYSLIFGFPLIGFLINGLCTAFYPNVSPAKVASTQTFPKKQSMVLAAVVGNFSILASLGVTFFLFQKLYYSQSIAIEWTLFKWISVGEFSIDFVFSFNRLSALLCFLITGIGFLIHLYSAGYMKDDKSPSRYFAYLNLFIFSMLILILGDNLLITFIGWEGVGLCSYLLIGYWHEDLEKASAGMKAFVVNRIGDAGFLVGMMVLYLNLGSLNYGVINDLSLGVTSFGWGAFTTVSLLLIFVGACGKSAQFPLYVWLPDAMAGPTPVSALIHAATMVTAGIYVLFRLNGLLAVSPEAMMVIAFTGGVTAFMAAFIALTQCNIKKILAYSTVSQLGYMVMAIGVGSHIGAVFHLFTHAFFKGLMFLCAGTVIHGLSGEQDIRKMGGLKKIMPLTHFSFVVGWLSIIGVPIFSGFFSKDEILFHTFTNERGFLSLWILGLLTAGMTAFYMTRLMCKVFWVEPSAERYVEPHEGSFLMTGPLMTLACLSLVSGFMGLPHLLTAVLPGHVGHLFSGWLSPMLVKPSVNESSLLLEAGLMLLSILVVLVGAFLAYSRYMGTHKKVNEIFNMAQHPVLVLASQRLLFVDEFYKNNIVAPFKETAKSLWLFIDVQFIDKIIMKLALSIEAAGKISGSVQSGRLQAYISVFAIMVTMFLMGALFL